MITPLTFGYARRKYAPDARNARLPGRAQPNPEGDGITVARRSAWAGDNLDPIVDPEPGQRYDFDSLAEEDRHRMAARAIRESELIGFWVAWHRAGGFAGLERGGWDRSTIFRKIRRFRSYYGTHPDNARFPWLVPDWARCWESDGLVTMNWASQRANPAPHRHGTVPIRPPPAETLAATGDVWTYATTEWLTHRCPTADPNRSRWPISPEW